MTEAEWLVINSPARMLLHLLFDPAPDDATRPGPSPDVYRRPRSDPLISERKLRLVAVAISRLLGPDAYSERLAEAWENVERAADGADLVVTGEGFWVENADPERSVRLGLRELNLDQRADAAAVFREIVGNPFLPVVRVDDTATPQSVHDAASDFVRRNAGPVLIWRLSWATETVRALAEAAYGETAERCLKCKGTGTWIRDQRADCPACRGTGSVVVITRNQEGTLDPARLAVLSDALEEAGCAEAALLTHLRSPGPHVRGCWALDLVLGRE